MLLTAPTLRAQQAGAGRAAAGAGPHLDGGALFAARCADCHGADATGVNGPDLTRLWASGWGDEEVFRTVRSGVPGSVMPPSSAPDEELRAIVAYLKSLGEARGAPLTWDGGEGDPARGRDLFRATCASCHRVNGQGGRLGPDLSRIAETRSRAQVVRAIREASATVADGYRSLTVVTRDGSRVRGIRMGEDAFSVRLLDTGERLRGFRKSELREVSYDRLSLMPDFGPDRLGDDALDHLLTYLATLRSDGAAMGGP